jgi:membrane associated rhomboid family serine protease
MKKSVTTPHVNRILLIVNIIIFAVYSLSSLGIFLDYRFADVMNQQFVMVPANILHGQQIYTLFTSMFMHANLLHLFGNMIFLYVFGDNVEDAFGHVGYLIFYLVCGLAAAFAYILINLYAPLVGTILGINIPSDLTSGVLGASGAIAGVLGAYFVLHPKTPAFIFLGVWFLLQWAYWITDISGGVAYFAHIGGFIAGIALTLTIGLRRKKALEARLRL